MELVVLLLSLVITLTSGRIFHYNTPRAAFKLPTVVTNAHAYNTVNTLSSKIIPHVSNIFNTLGSRTNAHTYNTHPTVLRIPSHFTFPFVYPSIVRGHTAPLKQGLDTLFLSSPVVTHKLHESQEIGMMLQSPIRRDASPFFLNIPFVLNPDRANSAPLQKIPQATYFVSYPTGAHVSSIKQEPAKRFAQVPMSFYSAPVAYISNTVANAHITPAILKHDEIALQSPVLSQYRSQDELGGYHFSYSGGPSSRAETRDHQGVVRGAYNYIDANGQVQRYQYIADKKGFRVVGTNIPVHPGAQQPEF